MLIPWLIQTNEYNDTYYKLLYFCILYLSIFLFLIFLFYTCSCVFAALAYDKKPEQDPPTSPR